MRYSTGLALVFVLLCCWGGLEYWHSRQRLRESEQDKPHRRHFQKVIGLPNLAVTSAARYLRHYSLTDLTTPFQDYPGSLDHFPAGFAFVPPDYSSMPTPIVFGKLPAGVRLADGNR